MAADPAPKFTLRFHDSQTYEILGVVAEHYGISKNRLAEELLARELQAAALLLDSDLTDTLELLRGYRRDEHLPRAIDAFAEAEAHERDPIATRIAAPPRGADAYGIADAFTA